METKKSIKKIVSLVGGTLLVGSTLVTGAALTANLADYPSPFIQDGKWSNTLMVVGDNAAASDVVGAIDLGMDLQGKAIKPYEESTTTTIEGGYEIDDLDFGEVIVKTISDRDIDTLFDDEVKFDGDHFDAEEVITLEGIKVAINEDEFKDKVYITIPEDGITYEFNIDSSIETGEIDEDETLNLRLLGEDVEITDWGTHTVTFTKGKEYTFDEGESKEIDGRTINITHIHSDDEGSYIRIVVDGESKKIYEKQTREVNDVQVRVVEAVQTGEGEHTDLAVVEIGDEVESEVEDGEEYSKDSIWDWKIDENSIGLVLTEEHTSIDEDEDYQALGENDELCLPNKYVCIVNKGISEEDTEKYTFTDDNEYDVEIKGNFIKGIEDYNKIYVDDTGIYDKDDDLIHTTTIELGDTDLELNLECACPSVGNHTFEYVDGECEYQAPYPLPTQTRVCEEYTCKSDGNYTFVYEDETCYYEVPVTPEPECDGVYTCPILLDGEEEIPFEIIDGICHYNETIFYTDPFCGIEIEEEWYDASTCNPSDLFEYVYEDEVCNYIAPYPLPTQTRVCDEYICPSDGDYTFKYVDGECEYQAPIVTPTANPTCNLKIDDINLNVTLDSVSVDDDNLCNKDDNYLTNYGIVIEDPENSCEDNEFTIVIPEDRITSTITLTSKDTVESNHTITGGVQIDTLDAGVARLASEVSPTADENVILIGGPCANALVSQLTNITCENWPLKEGESMIRLFEKGDKIAMLVAGTTAKDTRDAVKKVIQGGLSD